MCRGDTLVSGVEHHEPSVEQGLPVEVFTEFHLDHLF
jgi:hypothetical protein